MQKRFWAGAAGQARMQAQDTDGEEEKQNNILSVASQEEMAWGDAALSTAIPGPGLAAPPILSQGTPEQQMRFLGPFMDGQLHWGALALTEPGIGSDVAGMSTTAVLDGDEWVINGHKHYITNGARADLVVTFATIDKSLGREGIRPFVVPKGTPGMIVGRIEEKMGLRASQTAELIYENCRVPQENLLAGREKTQKAGFKAAMGTLDATRPMVGALAVGIARAAHETTREWVCDELPKGFPAHKRHEIEDELEELGQQIEMARLLVWRAAWMADRRIPNSKEASMSKAFAGALVMKVTSAGVRITAPGENYRAQAVPGEVVPRREGLRYLRGNRADPAPGYRAPPLPGGGYTIEVGATPSHPRMPTRGIPTCAISPPLEDLGHPAAGFNPFPICLPSRERIPLPRPAYTLLLAGD